MPGRFLIYAVAALVVALGLALALGLATSVVGPEPLASLEELREREVIFLDEHHIFLVYNEGEPLALSDDAQHVGDRVEFCESSQMFESPAHGEKFDILGHYYGGPAQRGLDRYPIRIEGDAVHVELDQPILGPERGDPPAREPEGSFCVFE